MTKPKTKAQLLAQVRELCLAMPNATERASHGTPTWFIGAKGRSFATFDDHHHGADRIALVCAAPDGLQAQLVADDPENYYVPPYVGGAGWIGVRLDRDVPTAEIARAVELAYAHAAAKRRR